MTRQNAALSSTTQYAMAPEFVGKNWGTEVSQPQLSRFLMSILLYAGYSRKLI